MTSRVVLLLLISVLLVGTADARIWTDATGTFSVKAELVGIADGEVQLKRDDGTVITVPISKLSQADLAFLETKNRPKTASRKEKLLVGEAAIRGVLGKPAKLEFNELPFIDAIKQLSESQKIPIILDQEALDDNGLATDTLVNFKSKARMLQDDLDLLLSTLRLTWLIENDVLVVTTPEVAETRLSLVVYKLMGNVDTYDIEDDIIDAVEYESWADVGGTATISVAAPLLIVSQSAGTHEKILQKFGEILKPVPPESIKPQKRRKKSTPRQALDQETECEFTDTPLKDVFRSLSIFHGVDISLNVNALEDAGIGGDEPVTVNLPEVRLSSALNLILQPLDLTWTVSEESIMITTVEDEKSRLSDIAYPASDFVVDGTLDTLIEVIEDHVLLGSWESVGGNCKLVPGEKGALNVTQTYAGHQQVSELLAYLSRAVR